MLADDNADMRDYVRRLLSDRYEVETAADGQAALAAIEAFGLDLIEFTLPYELDGKTLLEFTAEGVRCAIELPLGRMPAAQAPS